MTIAIFVDGNSATVALKKEATIIDELTWEANHELSSEILQNINSLLIKHNIEASAITTINTQISSTTGVTAARVAQTVAQAWNAAIRYC